VLGGKLGHHGEDGGAHLGQLGLRLHRPGGTGDRKAVYWSGKNMTTSGRRYREGMTTSGLHCLGAVMARSGARLEVRVPRYNRGPSVVPR
jgi:hypothetical protein